MIEKPRIAELEATRTAYIPLKIPRAEMQQAMGPAMEEVMATVAGQGMEPTGPVFAHHLAMHSGLFDFELGVPVAAQLTPSGRVLAGHRPATRVARTVYHGAYDGLPQAWQEFHQWIERQDLAWGPDVWEIYVVHPGADPLPENWRTELNRPLLP